MKVFFIDKYSALSFFLIGAVCFILFSNTNEAYTVYSSFGRELPIYSVDTKEKAVSITFDTAWGNEDIGKIISVLEEAGCKATFFITGEWADKFPGDVKRLYMAGHEIANHSDDHAHMSSLTAQQMADNIAACDKKIRDITGQGEVLFRAPYGEYNKTLLSVCRETERYIIQWSIDSLDYTGLSTAEMEQRILPRLRGGDIILFHTGTDNTAAALPEILSKIKERGYSLKKTGELIYKDNFETDHEGRQSQR